jgi:hypothetical protein
MAIPKIFISVGLALGAFLLQAIIPKKKTPGQDRETPTADYGSSIDRSWGDDERRNTTLVWASELVERKGKGGGGKGKNPKRGLTGSFQVIVGEGQVPPLVYYNDSVGDLGKHVLKPIYFNKKLWWSSTQTGKQANQRSNQFTFYDGSLNQVPDPTLIAALGVANVPPYQGISHIVFRDINVSKDSNGNYPAVEVVTDVIGDGVRDSISAISVVRDLFYRCGSDSNRQLAPEVNYKLNIPATNLALGLTFPQNSPSMADILGQVTLINREVTANVYSKRMNQTLWFGYTPEEVSQLRADTDLFSADIPTTPISVETTTEEETPGAVSISYRNRRNNFEPLEISVSNPISIGSGSEQLSLNFSYRNPNQAITIGRQVLLSRAYGKGNYTFDYTTAWISHLELGRKLLVSYSNTQLYKSTTQLGWPNGIVQSVSIGSDFTHRVTFVQAETSFSPDPEVLPLPPDNNNSEFDADGAPEVFWFEGARRISPIDEPPQGRLVNVILAREPGIPSTVDSQLLYTTDNGSSYQTIPGASHPPNAVKIKNIELSQAPDIQNIGTIDYTTILTVQSDPSTRLESIPLNNAFDFVNVLYLEGYGLVQFLQSTLIATNRYEVTGLIWNILDTAAYAASTVRAGSLLVDGYLMEDQLISTPVPSAVVVGTPNNFGLVADADGILSNQLAGNYFTNGETQFDDANSQPRPPKNILTSPTATDVTISWDAGESQSSVIPRSVGDPAVPVTDVYTVHIINPTVNSEVAISSIPATGSSLTIPFTTLDALPGDKEDYTIAVVEEPASGIVYNPVRHRFQFLLFP